jgi:hypothetical protein
MKARNTGGRALSGPVGPRARRAGGDEPIDAPKQNSMEENGRSVAWQNGDIAGVQ